MAAMVGPLGGGRPRALGGSICVSEGPSGRCEGRGWTSSRVLLARKYHKGRQGMGRRVGRGGSGVARARGCLRVESRVGSRGAGSRMMSGLTATRHSRAMNIRCRAEAQKQFRVWDGLKYAEEEPWRQIIMEDSFIEPAPGDWFSDEDIERIENEGPMLNDLYIDDDNEQGFNQLTLEWAKQMDIQDKLEVDTMVRMTKRVLQRELKQILKGEVDGRNVRNNKEVERLKSMTSAEREQEISEALLDRRMWAMERLYDDSTEAMGGAWEVHLYDRLVPSSVLGTKFEDQLVPNFHNIKEAHCQEVVRLLRKRQWHAENFDPKAPILNVAVWFATDDRDSLLWKRNEKFNLLRYIGLYPDSKRWQGARIVVKEEGSPALYCKCPTPYPTLLNPFGYRAIFDEIEKVYVQHLPKDLKDLNMKVEMAFWKDENAVRRKTFDTLDYAREFTATDGEEKFRRALESKNLELKPDFSAEQILGELADAAKKQREEEIDGAKEDGGPVASSSSSSSSGNTSVQGSQGRLRGFFAGRGGGGKDAVTPAPEAATRQPKEQSELDKLDAEFETDPAKVKLREIKPWFERYMSFPMLRVTKHHFKNWGWNDHWANQPLLVNDSFKIKPDLETGGWWGNAKSDRTEDMELWPDRMGIQQWQPDKKMMGQSLKEWVLNNPWAARSRLWFITEKKYALAGKLLADYYRPAPFLRVLTPQDIRSLHGAFDTTGEANPFYDWAQMFTESGLERRKVNNAVWNFKDKFEEAGNLKKEDRFDCPGYDGRPMPKNIFEVFNDEELAMMGVDPNDDPDVKWQPPGVFPETLKHGDRTQQKCDAVLKEQLQKDMWVAKELVKGGNRSITPGLGRMNLTFHQAPAAREVPGLLKGTQEACENAAMIALGVGFVFGVFYFGNPLKIDFQKYMGNSDEPMDLNVAEALTQSKPDVHQEGKTGVLFTDIGGLNRLIGELMEIVDFLKSPAKYRRVGAIPPKGVLLEGPPGCGKTLIAKALANEAGVPFFSMAGSEFVEDLTGVGAARVRDLFKRAKVNSPCIVFVDEIDALGSSRSGMGEGGQVKGDLYEHEAALNQLLSCLDGFEPDTGTIFIGCTNRADLLDAALVRPGRFDKNVRVDVPDVLGREEILEICARRYELGEDVSLSQLALDTPDFSGAQLDNMLNESALIAARRKSEVVCRADIREALDRVILGAPKLIPVEQSNATRILAIHESGNSIVSSVLRLQGMKVAPIERVTITPRENKPSSTVYLRLEDDDYAQLNIEDLKARITILLSGRVGEGLMMGHEQISMYGADDFQNATVIAKRIITAYGMDLKMGIRNRADTLIGISDANTRYDEIAGALAGMDLSPEGLFNFGMARNPSPRQMKEEHERTRYIMEEAMERCHVILTEHRGALEELTQVLLDRPWGQDVKGFEIEEIVRKSVAKNLSESSGSPGMKKEKMQS